MVVLGLTADEVSAFLLFDGRPPCLYGLFDELAVLKIFHTSKQRKKRLKKIDPVYQKRDLTSPVTSRVRFNWQIPEGVELFIVKDKVTDKSPTAFSREVSNGREQDVDVSGITTMLLDELLEQCILPLDDSRLSYLIIANQEERLEGIPAIPSGPTSLMEEIDKGSNLHDPVISGQRAAMSSLSRE